MLSIGILLGGALGTTTVDGEAALGAIFALPIACGVVGIPAFVVSVVTLGRDRQPRWMVVLGLLLSVIPAILGLFGIVEMISFIRL
jgi:hypothetical protein